MKKIVPLKDVELDITSVSAVVAVLGVLVGVALTLLEFRQQTEIQQTNLVMSLFSHFGSKELQDSWQRIMGNEYENYGDYVEKYGMADAWEVFMFFEGDGSPCSSRTCQD